MATYAELFALASSGTISALRQKINVAISIKAQAIAEAGNTHSCMKANRRT